MKSFPNMVDMKRDATDKMAEASADGLMMPAMSDMPDYDCGLCISFNKETLGKLDLDNDVAVGDFVEIHSFAQVTSISKPAGSDEIDRVSLCMTHINCEEENEDEAI